VDREVRFFGGMLKWIHLSFLLSVDTPVFPGSPSVEVRAFSSLSRGDCSNTFSISFYNHAGTHMDAPRHFYNDGKAITDFRFSEFVYENPIVVNIPKQDSELIMKSDLLKYFDVIKEADLLLIRTGFTKFRSSEPLRYASKSPGFTGETAVYLKKSFPNLRAIGIDFISAAAPEHLETGLEFHRIILDPHRVEGCKFIIEDMDLTQVTSSLRRVVVVPFLVQGIDSAPCTVFGEIK
jgi:arylformamidase